MLDGNLHTQTRKEVRSERISATFMSYYLDSGLVFDTAIKSQAYGVVEVDSVKSRYQSGDAGRGPSGDVNFQRSCIPSLAALFGDYYCYPLQTSRCRASFRPISGIQTEY